MSRPLKVFIGCPGDMAPERDLLLSLGKKLANRGCPVEFLIWPDVPPAAGRPQQVIFDQFPVETWDVFIGLLWNRFGSPAGEKDERTGTPMTGTEEEFKRAYAAWKASAGRRPHIAVYRCERAEVTKGKGAQIAAVDAFFDQLAAEKDYPALSFSFTDPHKFKDAIEEHLVEIIGKIRAAGKAVASAKRTAKTGVKKAIDWVAAEETYRRHLIDSHRIVKFHTAEARAPVEVELEKVFIKLLADQRSTRDRTYTIFADGDLVGGTPEELWARLREKSADGGADVVVVHQLVGRSVEETRLKRGEFERELARASDRFNTSRSPSAPTSLPDLLRQQKHLALAGSPGSGKSTLLQYLVLTFASRQQHARLQLDEERLPVFIRLRQFHRWAEGRRHERKFGDLKPAHIHEFLAQQWAEEKGSPELPVEFFPWLLRDERALILLDGLDEIADPAQRRAIVALVATTLDDWREARVILTSRPKAWEREGRAALGSRVGEARICDLDDAQIEEFVRHWYLAATIAARGDTPSARGHAESRAVDLIAAVKPERIRRLAATPLMLSILAMVHSRGVGLPQERSQLYHECIEFMLGYWDEVAGFSPDPELHEVARLDRQTKRQLLEPVALWMHRLGSEQIEPLHGDLVKRFAAGFTSVLNEPPECAQRHARAFLRLIVERGGLMQESEAGQFRFVHLTFQEYLAASAIAHGEAPFDQVTDHLHDPWWREIILLAGGELSRQRSYRVKSDTTAWLESILKADTWAEKYLLRDLQSAAQSCADMIETGVEAKITTDLAARIVEAVPDGITASATVDLSNFIRQLSAGHLTRAIARRVVQDISAKKKINVPLKLLRIAELLPASVISETLLDLFEEASRDKAIEVSYAGVVLSILHGPESARLARFGTLRHKIRLPLSYGGASLTKLFDLGDTALTEAILDWERERLSSGDSDDFVSSASVLLQHGTAADRATALSALAAGLAIKEDARSCYAMITLGELGSLADTPEVIASLETVLADPQSENICNALTAWREIVRRRTTPVSIAPLRAILHDAKSQGWSQAAALALKHGDQKDREVIRAALKSDMDRLPPIERLPCISILLVFDPEADRPALAAQVEDILARSIDLGNGTIYHSFEPPFTIARQLADLVWNCPRLIAFIRESAQSETDGCEMAVSVLAELVRVRPVAATIPAPTHNELAEMALNLEKNPNRSTSGMIQAIHSVSLFHQKRRSPSPNPPFAKGAVSGKKKLRGSLKK